MLDFKKNLFCVALFIFCFPVKSMAVVRQAVTYNLSPGRFGDNLLTYMHAKWISYKHKLPLLYKPFLYSNKLILHQSEPLYVKSVINTFSKTVVLGSKNSVNQHESSSILYVVPYFPESKWELKNCKNFQKRPWDSFEIDWNDKGFIEELRKMIAPIEAIPLLNLPADRITVAVHVRRGGNYDNQGTFEGAPLKFLSDDFFIKEIRQLYYFLGEKPLYVHLFTDDLNPVKIMNTFKNNLKGLDIQFNCREEDNSDTKHVIEDFFAMQQFDCLIHSESNFSFTMSKIGNYMVSLFPDSFYKKGSEIIYDHVNMSTNYDHLGFKII